MIDPIDREILIFVQDDIPLESHPYSTLAQKLHLSEDEICARLRKLCETGLIRRFGAILRHVNAGYAANAMVVWKVEDSHLDQAASILAASDSVSHVYARPSFDEWPYKLYSMIHAHNDRELERIIHDLARKIGSLSEEFRVLRSVREFKKSSMKYFIES
jgi:DNA-binding Lrp family transcriptional regulator